MYRRRPGILHGALRWALIECWCGLSWPWLPGLGRGQVLWLGRPGQYHRTGRPSMWTPIGLSGRLHDYRCPLLLGRMRDRGLRQLRLHWRLQGHRRFALLSLIRLPRGTGCCLLATRVLRVDVARSRQTDGLGDTRLLRRLLGRLIPMQRRLLVWRTPLLLLLGLWHCLKRHLLLNSIALLLSWLPTRA